MTIQTEISGVYDPISQYLTSRYTYLTSGGAYPDMDPIKSLEYSELLSYVSNLAQGAAGFEVGAAQEAVLTAVAISREIDMATVPKSQIYVNCASESQMEADFYTSSGAYFLGVSLGTSTNGSRS